MQVFYKQVVLACRPTEVWCLSYELNSFGLFFLEGFELNTAEKECVRHGNVCAKHKYGV